MSKNKNSTDGIAEDLIRSFVQMTNVELHFKTLIEKRVGEIENGLVEDDDMSEQMQTIDRYKMHLDKAANLRRAQMLYLYNMYNGKGNKEMWCLVKHSAMAMYNAFEVYQASDEDPELLSYALQINVQFNEIVAEFLGVQITPCAACFSDILKGELDKIQSKE